MKQIGPTPPRIEGPLKFGDAMQIAELKRWAKECDGPDVEVKELSCLECNGEGAIPCEECNGTGAKKIK